jgi:hypothetical protein
MGWPTALTVGAIAGIAGLFLAFFVGDAVSGAYRVSSFEGARGYLVVWVFAPLGLVAGLILGIVIGLHVDGAGSHGFLKVQGFALAATGVAIGGVGGLAMLLADRPPTLDGKELVVELEIRTPAKPGILEELKAGELRASLNEDRVTNLSSDVHFDRAATRDGYVVIPSTSGLYTHRQYRAFTIALSGPEGKYAGSIYHVFELRTPGKPTKADTAWSDWQRIRTPLNDTERKAAEAAPQFEIRYRVAPGRNE